jgi:hypothetical protein
MVRHIRVRRPPHSGFQPRLQRKDVQQTYHFVWEGLRTLFQAVLTVESDDEAESTPSNRAPPPHYAQANILVDETDDDEEREYYTEVIDGVRYLQYSVVVPPDGPGVFGPSTNSQQRKRQ